MKLRSKRWRPLAVAGMAACVGVLNVPAQAQSEGAIEEIVVTGS